MSMALGLALANHHFLRALVAAGRVLMLARVVQEQGSKSLLLSASFVALGLCTYSHLPLRALSGVEPALGSPSTLSRFFWVVSAEVFQKSSTITAQPTSDRMLDVIVLMFESMGPFAILASLVGIYALARTQGLSRFAWIWGGFSFFRLLRAAGSALCVATSTRSGT